MPKVTEKYQVTIPKEVREKIGRRRSGSNPAKRSKEKSLENKKSITNPPSKRGRERNSSEKRRIS
jgi:bifunctional DNA-binding transcriptional regulator/antitoxin component of YhaV-PrlF toxin-antitoxin module